MNGEPNGAYDELEAAFRAMPGKIGATPRALLVISGHWEDCEFTVLSSPKLPTIRDYAVFPEHRLHHHKQSPVALTCG